jgi:hypothetical protein
MNKIAYALVVLVLLINAAPATTRPVPVDDLNNSMFVGQLQFEGEGNYTLELDAPQMEHAQFIRLNNLTRNATYQITFTARPVSA